MKEAEKKLPLSYEFVTSTTKNKCKFVTAKQALVLSSILNSWNLKSLFVYRNNVLLISAGCKGEEIERREKSVFKDLGYVVIKTLFEICVLQWERGLINMLLNGKPDWRITEKQFSKLLMSQAVNVDVCNEPQTLATGV